MVRLLSDARLRAAPDRGSGGALSRPLRRPRGRPWPSAVWLRTLHGRAPARRRPASWTPPLVVELGLGLTAPGGAHAAAAVRGRPPTSRSPPPVASGSWIGTSSPDCPWETAWRQPLMSVGDHRQAAGSCLHRRSGETLTVRGNDEEVESGVDVLDVVAARRQRPCAPGALRRASCFGGYGVGLLGIGPSHHDEDDLGVGVVEALSGVEELAETLLPDQARDHPDHHVVGADAQIRPSLSATLLVPGGTEALRGRHRCRAAPACPARHAQPGSEPEGPRDSAPVRRPSTDDAARSREYTRALLEIRSSGLA